MEYLECDVCQSTYYDPASVDAAKAFEEDWKKLCQKDGEVARGVAPCPNLRCRGQLRLKNRDLQDVKQLEDLRATRV